MNFPFLRSLSRLCVSLLFIKLLPTASLNDKEDLTKSVMFVHDQC